MRRKNPPIEWGPVILAKLYEKQDVTKSKPNGVF